MADPAEIQEGVQVMLLRTLESPFGFGLATGTNLTAMRYGLQPDDIAGTDISPWTTFWAEHPQAPGLEFLVDAADVAVV